MIRGCPFVWLLVSLAPCLCRAGQVEKFYYVGEMKLSSPTGKPIGSQAFLLEKTHDPDKGMIIERAIVVGADGKAEEYVMDMKLSDNSFSLADRSGKVKGSGELFGPPPGTGTTSKPSTASTTASASRTKTL